MVSLGDIINIFLPVLSHWLIWLIFLLVVLVALLLYAYPYIRKPCKEFHLRHIAIPITFTISLYIFAKMLEGVLYHGAILKVDSWFNQAMIALHTPMIDKIALFITSFGSGVPFYILLIIAVGTLLLRRRWGFAIISITAISGSTILQLVIKELVQRVRPENLLEKSFSFPSGHAITAIVFVALLIYSFKGDIKHLALRYVLITAASVFFIAIAVSRIILNVHWFSDVIAGMSLGLAWFMLLVLIERSIPGVVPAIKKETQEAKPIPVAIVETAKAIVPSVLKK